MLAQAEHYYTSTFKATEWLSHRQQSYQNGGEKKEEREKEKKRANHKLTAGQPK